MIEWVLKTPDYYAMITEIATLHARAEQARAEVEQLREALRVKHEALERLTYLYESEQDTEALERIGRPDWLRAALAKAQEEVTNED